MIDGTPQETEEELEEKWKEFTKMAEKAAPFKPIQPGPLEKLGDKLGAEVADWVNTAEEAGKDIWDEFRGVFDLSKKEETETKPAASGNKKKKAE